MSIKAFLNKSGWYDYTFHNPFMTKEQVEKHREYAKGGWFNDSKKYADFHPKEDELLTGLKTMLEPDAKTLKRLGGKLLYSYQRFIRKHSDVRGKALAGRSEEEQAGWKRCQEEDKKCMKNWDEIQARIENWRAEWKTKELARKLSERCLVMKDRSYRRH